MIVEEEDDGVVERSKCLQPVEHGANAIIEPQYVARRWLAGESGFPDSLRNRVAGRLDIERAVKDVKAGKIEFRNDDTGNLHAVMGKKSFEKAKLVDNVQVFLDHVAGLKPPTSKGVFIKKATLSTTMGPGVPLRLS